MSFKIAVNKAVAEANDLKKYLGKLHDDSIRSELEVNLGDILTALALLMDKTMSLVFEKYGIKDDRKPNIYFPECSSEEKLTERVKKDKLNDLPIKSPEVYSIIKSCQPFAEGNSN